MPILGPDLTYQMLAQRLLAVRPEIIVEISNRGSSTWQPIRPRLLVRSTSLPLRARWIAVDGDVEALHPLRQQDGSEVTRRERRPDGKAGALRRATAWSRCLRRRRGCRHAGSADGIAEKVTHGTPLRLDPRLPLTVRREPGAMHALQGPCPIGDCRDQRWSRGRSGSGPPPDASTSGGSAARSSCHLG